MIDVTVIKAGTFLGRALRRGETVRVKPVEALAMARQGLISLTVGAATPEPSRRRYRRRDLTADPA